MCPHLKTFLVEHTYYFHMDEENYHQPEFHDVQNENIINGQNLSWSNSFAEAAQNELLKFTIHIWINSETEVPPECLN